LYVESTNVVALRLYESLGFRRHHINRAYRGDMGNPFDS
jgi:ribosomal protein S18 acetylase RimI-like enzyme